MSAYITKELLSDFLAKLDSEFGRSGKLYLIGETSHVFEGWRDWTTQIEICADVADEDRAAFARAVADTQAATGCFAINESPGDLIPLPEGYESRARDCGDAPTHALTLHHFDPYSVSFRFIARGDEPDYHIVLMYLAQNWITFDEMDQKLAALLPTFTAETIQQDPAEFRRKYKGLLQMYRAVKPRTTHRSSAF